jgi:hypothetical protein
MKRAIILLSALFVATTVTFAAPPRAMDAHFAEIQKELEEIGRLAGAGKHAKARKEQKKLQAKVDSLFPVGSTFELSKACPVYWTSMTSNGILNCATRITFWWDTIPDDMLEKIEDLDANDMAGTFQVIRSVGPIRLSVTEEGRLLVPIRFVLPTSAE